MTEPDAGRVLWKVERDHRVYGYERAALVVNLASELLLVAEGVNDETAATLTGDDARGLRDALTEHLGSASTYIRRRRDEPARAAYVEEPVVESLAAARVGIEHVEHHGRPLRFVGSTHTADLTEHRFACADSSCPVRLAWSVTE